MIFHHMVINNYKITVTEIYYLNKGVQKVIQVR